MTESDTAAHAMLADAFKDLVKASIALPIEGCKSMATGCAQVAALYGATLALSASRLDEWDWIRCFELLGPLFVYAIAGFLFGTGFLPSQDFDELFPAGRALAKAPAQHAFLLDRQQHLRRHFARGTILFWLALIWAFAAVIYVRTSQSPAPLPAQECRLIQGSFKELQCPSSTCMASIPATRGTSIRCART